MPNLKNSLALWVNDTSTILGNLHAIKSMGVDRIVVCIVKHNPVPVAVPYQSDNLKQLLEDAATVGLAVDAWFYGYPTGIDEQVQVIAGILNAHQQFGNVYMDMEVEWENVSGDLADYFAHNLAQATSHRVALHLSSFCNPDAHPLPYAHFLAHCESLMPQSYRVGSTPVEVVMDRTLEQCPQLAANTLGGELIATVNRPEMLAAIAASGPSKFTAVNIWLWDGADEDMGVRGVADQWTDAIAAYKAAFC